MQQFDTFQKFSKDTADAMLKAFGTATKSAQTIAVETTDFAKRQFEQGSAALEQLAGARSLEKAVEIQTAYARSTYEGLVAQSTKMGELYANLARDAMKPYEGLVAGFPAPTFAAAPFQAPTLQAAA